MSEIKLVNDHKGGIAYVSKIAGSDGINSNGARFVAGSNTIRTWNNYPTYEQAAAAWNDGSVVQELEKTIAALQYKIESLEAYLYNYQMSESDK